MHSFYSARKSKSFSKLETDHIFFAFSYFDVGEQTLRDL